MGDSRKCQTSTASPEGRGISPRISGIVSMALGAGSWPKIWPSFQVVIRGRGAPSSVEHSTLSRRSLSREEVKGKGVP